MILDSSVPEFWISATDNIGMLFSRGHTYDKEFNRAGSWKSDGTVSGEG